MLLRFRGAGRRVGPLLRTFATSPETSAIRNVAIIAHVDHGKTTLVDKLLTQAGLREQTGADRVMDNIALEQERGITIMSKVTRIALGDHVFNIVDTPGHSDFGGEVERVISMVDSVVLVVDACEGPMPQTKFVLSKALQANLSPIVVINKVDRQGRRVPGGVENEVFDLFVNLDATDDQLEYPVLYGSAKNGWVIDDLDDEANENKDLMPLFRALEKHVPEPKVDRTSPFQMLVTSIEYDDFLGKIVTGKIRSGMCAPGDTVQALTRDGKKIGTGKVTKIKVRSGLIETLLDGAGAGDIVSIAGIDAGVTDTICSPEVNTPLKSIPLDPPTISMTFAINDSPLCGKEGSKMNSSYLEARLYKEIENNVGITLKKTEGADSIEVQGRGELQMAILIEQLRREGFELSIFPPRVLMKRGENKELLEPFEELTIDVENEYVNAVISKLQKRGGEMTAYNDHASEGKTRLTFTIPSRRFIGYRSEFQTDTRGSGVLCSMFHGYHPYADVGSNIRGGCILSKNDGKTTAYALQSIENRGVLFVGPREDVYYGMIIGESTGRDTADLEVNPCKEKKLTNMRAAGKEDTIRLTPPRTFTLESAIAYAAEDEVVEVTPTAIRLRKHELDPVARKKMKKGSVGSKYGA